jgi:hypothetical protein
MSDSDSLIGTVVPLVGLGLTIGVTKELMKRTQFRARRRVRRTRKGFY